MPRIVFMCMLLAGVIACSGGDSQNTADHASEVGQMDSAEDTAVEGVPCVEGWAVGMCPPDFTLIDARGELRSLSELRGQPILVLGTAEW